MKKRSGWIGLLCLLLAGLAWRVDAGQAQQTGYALNFPLVVRNFQPGPGDLSGVVINASNQNQTPIAGAQICVRALCTTTDVNGRYRFEGLYSGVYPVTAGQSGFANLLQWGLVEPRRENTLNFALSPLLESGDILMRFVLTWDPTPYWPGNNENDLDAHLWLSVPDPPTHVYFENPGDCTCFPDACLEADARFGFGPESIALSGIKISTYYYGVVNWNQYHPGVPPITATNASVQVYGLDGVLESFTVPRHGKGNFWYVFRIISTDGETGVLERVNCITNFPPEGELPVCP